MKKNTTVQYARGLYEATKGLSGKDLNSVLARFAEILYKEHQIKKTNRIITEFTRYAKKQQGVQELKVVSARKLGHETIKHLQKIFGAKSEIEESIDETLLGGVVVKTDDKIFDASLKRQLLRLKNSLI